MLSIQNVASTAQEEKLIDYDRIKSADYNNTQDIFIEEYQTEAKYHQDVQQRNDSVGFGLFVPIAIAL